jgi:hypothetical protein
MRGWDISENAKVIAVDVTSPFSQMAMEEEQPLLMLVITSSFLALMLILPAAVDAVRRGCGAVWSYLAASLVAPFQEGPDGRPGPRGLKSWGAGEWGPFS